MNITVQGSEEYGNSIYGELFERVLIDLGLTNRVEEVKMLIFPERPLFLVSVRTRKARTAVKVTAVSTITARDGNTCLVIGNESYAPALLALLWKQFGRERIEQISRLEILAHGIKPEAIQEFQLDPGEELKKEVLDAIWRLLPEGFKVRYNLFTDEVITIAATEHVMKPEFVQAAEATHKEMAEGWVAPEAKTEVEGEEEDDEEGEA